MSFSTAENYVNMLSADGWQISEEGQENMFYKVVVKSTKDGFTTELLGQGSDRLSALKAAFTATRAR